MLPGALESDEVGVLSCAELRGFAPQPALGLRDLHASLIRIPIKSASTPALTAKLSALPAGQLARPSLFRRFSIWKVCGGRSSSISASWLAMIRLR